MKNNVRLLAAIVAAALVSPLCAAGATGDWIAYIGTYTRQKSKGIYAYRFAPKTGGPAGRRPGARPSSAWSLPAWSLSA